MGEGKQEELGICSATRILGRCPNVEGMVLPPLILPMESYVSEIPVIFFIYKVFKNFGCVGSLLLHVGFPLVAASGGYSSLRCAGFSCGVFSCCGARALGARASVVVARGLSSCGARASLLRGMWDLPGPGLEPVSPALAGGFLTTAPPGKPYL